MVTDLLNNKSQTQPKLVCTCVFGERQVFICSLVGLLLFYTVWEFLRNKCDDKYKQGIRTIPWVVLKALS